MKNLKIIEILLAILGIIIIGSVIYFYNNSDDELMVVDTSNSYEDRMEIKSGNLTYDEKDENIIYYNIPEANIRFIIPKELEGLTYVEYGDAFWFSAKELNDLPNDYNTGCSGKRGSLGALAIYKEKPDWGGDPLIQDDDIFIYYDTPHDPCSLNKDVQEIQSHLLGLVYKSTKTIEFLDKINMRDHREENNFTIDLNHRNNHPTFGGGETILTINGSDNEILNTIIFSSFLEQKFNYENKFYYEQINYESEGELYILDLDKEKLELMYLDIGNLGIYDEKSMTYVGTGNTEKGDAIETCSNSESGGTRYQSAIKILNLKTGKVSILLGSKNNRFDIYKYSDGVIRYGLYEFDIDSNEGCIIGDYIGTFEINI